MKAPRVTVAIHVCLALVVGQTAAQEWREISGGPGPSPRRNAAAVYDPVGHRVVLFGGRGSSGDLNDLWALDLASETWELIPTAAGPTPRFTHESVYDPLDHRMLVWSGRKVDADGSGLFNDVWSLDLATHRWVELDTGDGRPNLRYGTASVYDPESHALVTFAGFTDEGRFHDTWRLDLATATWRDISPADGDPGRRCLHSAAYDAGAGRMLIYGGQRSGALGDLWSLDLQRLQWTELEPATRPPDRFFTALAHDPANGQLLIFGGDTGTEKLGDLWAYSLEAGTWQPVDVLGSGPAPRDGAVAIHIPTAGRVLIFGGTGSGHFADTWFLEGLGDRATAVSETRGGRPATAHLSAHPNPFNGQVVLDYGLAAGDLAGTDLLGMDLAAPARVEVWNLLGQRVWQAPVAPNGGSGGRIVWNGRDRAGRPAASGVYVARLIAGPTSKVVPIALVR